MPKNSPHSHRLFFLALAVALMTVLSADNAQAATLQAGVAKVDITNRDAGPVNDPLYVKALVIRSDTTTAVIVTLDAVAIAEIGSIRDPYLANVRARVQKELGIAPTSLIVNASHCHGKVCVDVEDRTVQAIREAASHLVPVRVGAGRGHEDRVQENRRLKLKNGREIDIRHAYSMPADEDVAAVGPIDPDIGLLRLDKEDGQTLAVVFQFACHPIMGVPTGANTADLSGFAAKAVEDSFGNGTVALFLQGCGGDINPVGYKDIGYPRDGEPLGNRLGLSAVRGAKQIAPRDTTDLKILNETLTLPRADLAGKIEELQAEQLRLLGTLKGTTLNLKSFLALRKNVAESVPSYYSHRYLHEKQLGRTDLESFDVSARRDVEAYVKNVLVMEELTRVQTNLALLKMHQAQNVAAGSRTIDVEVVGLRVGEFVLLTFPGELTVQIGLNLKKVSPHLQTFISGYTNGYVYYAPTAEQLKNVGGAQEDSDCILAPEWHQTFETRAVEVLKKL